MDKIESLGSYDHMLSEYRTFCDGKMDLINKCIDLAVNTDLGEVLEGQDERVPDELAMVVRTAKLQISDACPPGSTSYLSVNYQGKRVLTATHTNYVIDLENEESEFHETVDIERFIPGEWTDEIEQFYRQHFNS